MSELQFVVRNPEGPRPQQQKRAGILAGSRLWGPAAGAAVAAVLVLTPTAPRIVLEPAELEFGDRLVGGEPEERVLPMTNGGASVLRVQGIVLGGAQGADFSVPSNGCAGAELSPGKVCLVQVRFVPRDGGPRSAMLSVIDNAAGSPHQVALLGAGTVRGDLKPEPPSLEFGDVAVGATRELTFQVKNVGSKQVVVDAVRPVGDAFAIIENGCKGVLQKEAACSVLVRFTASGAGIQNGRVMITDDTGDPPHSVPLAGNGLLPKTAALSAKSDVDFGAIDVGRSATGTLKLETSGTAPLRIDKTVKGGQGMADFTVADDPCSGNDVPPSGCTLKLEFRPHTNGTSKASLSIYSNAEDSPRTVVLSGIGKGALVIDNGQDGQKGKGSPSTGKGQPLDFGDQQVGAQPSVKTFQFNVVGGGVAHPGRSSILSGSESFQIVRDQCAGATVPTGSHCDVWVQYLPKGSPGSDKRLQNGEMLFPSDAIPPRLIVPLSGFAVPQRQ